MPVILGEFGLVEEFFSTRLPAHPGQLTPARALYTAFVEWAEAKGVDSFGVPSENTFGKQATLAGYPRKRLSWGCAYIGISPRGRE